MSEVDEPGGRDSDPGEHGEGVPGPPWILGHRGAPLECPENTLVSLRRALERGLDGVEYDLQACATGEPVLLHDDTLDRTTDGHGPVSLLTLPELAGIDAGAWFDRRYAGEPLPLFEEALALPADDGGRPPRHMIEIKDPSLAREVALQLKRLERPLPVHVASFHRAVCLEARDQGLPTMLLSEVAEEDDRLFVRDERVDAYGTGPGGWRTAPGREPWSCERWSWSVDEPDDLLEACRTPLAGFNTNEPLRALAVRALVRLAPEDRGPYPVRVSDLEVGEPAAGEERGLHGEWSGRWRPEARIRNPFARPVEVALALAVRGGAFEVEGLPVRLDLAPGEERFLAFGLSGGSWSPGADPLLFARFVWRAGPGRPRESLILEAPVPRRRRLRLRDGVLRLPMLCESPHAPPATMTLRRRGDELLAWVEDPGGLRDVRSLLRLGVGVRRGGRGVRVRLPEGFDREGEVPFSIGFEGEDASGTRQVRRWAGGLLGELFGGAPGRLVPTRRS